MLKDSIHLMGTVIDVTLESKLVAAGNTLEKQLMAEIFHDLAVYEKRFSANDATSELAQVNQQAGQNFVEVAPELFHLIQVGKAESLQPGLLNIAIGPLIQTWRIGFSDARVPSQTEIQRLLLLIDPREILLEPQHLAVKLNRPGMKIDLGALAKGYIADLIVEKYQDQLQSLLLNLGGNVVSFGTPLYKPDHRFHIGIQNPKLGRDNYDYILQIQEESVVTSGIYERSLQQNGTNYHHIFDSQTGYPMQNDLLSLTIVSKKSLVGEIYTTQLFGLSQEEILTMIETIPTIEGIIYTEAGVVLSSGIQQKLI